MKANHSGSVFSSSPRISNGRLSADNIPLRPILEVAYGLDALQIVGPDWLDSDRFDLAGTVPQGVPDNDLMPLLQSLLKDRSISRPILRTGR